MARIVIVDSHALPDTAAERITALVAGSIAARGHAFVSLTGGTTSRSTYEALADVARPWRQRLDWSRVHLFWGDERHVPPDHPDSNFGMANHALLEHVPLPPGHVHRMRGELRDPHAAAAEYGPQLPDVFDVMLLGLGDDCHIASIFPGSELLAGWSTTDPRTDQTGPRASAISTPKGWRITLTPPVILGSRTIVMVVSGAQKSAAVTAAIEGPLDVQRYPGQLLRDAGDRVEWILDAAAAGGLR